MKLIFAVLDVSLTMGLTRCCKTERFYVYKQESVCLIFYIHLRYDSAKIINICEYLTELLQLNADYPYFIDIFSELTVNHKNVTFYF